MANFISDYAVVEPLPALRAGRAGPAKSYSKGGEYGRGSVQFSADPTATDVIILNGVYIEFSASATDFSTPAGTLADPYIMQVTGTLATTVGNFVTALNGSANASLAVATYSYNSGGAGDTLTIIYDTLADSSTYTIDTSGLTAAPTAADTALTGGQAVVTLSDAYENIDIAITDSNHQYFTLADAPETTKKTILLSAKSTGDAVISINGSNVTLSAANQYLKLQFLGGDWRTLVDPSASALNDLVPTDSYFIVGNGTTWVTETGATVRTSLGFTDPILDKAAPGAIGGTTPAAITGTTVTGTTVAVAADGDFAGDTGTASATTGAATLSKMAGIITSEALTTAAGATYTLTLTNTKITANSNILVTTGYGTSTAGVPIVQKVTPGAGSASIVILNNDAAAALNGTILIQYMIVG